MKKNRVAGLLFVVCAVALLGFMDGRPQSRPAKRQLENPVHLQADLEATDLRIEPVRPTAATAAKVFLTVRNRGEEPARASSLSLRANGKKIRVQAVGPLKPGEKRNVSFDWTPDASGLCLLVAWVYSSGLREISMSNNMQHRQVIVLGKDLAEARIRVLKVALSPQNPQPGEVATASLTVKNAGAKAVKNFPLRLRLGRKAAKWLCLQELAAGEEKQLKFHWRVQPGDDRLEVSAKPEETSGPARPVRKKEEDDDGQRPEEQDLPVAYEMHPTNAPDLKIPRMSVQVVRDEEGERGVLRHLYSISFEVTNISAVDLNGPFSTKVTLEGEADRLKSEPLPVQIYTKNGLRAGESVTYQWNVSLGHDVLKATAWADYDLKHRETEERNNSRTASCDTRKDEVGQWKSLGPVRIEGEWDTDAGYPAVGRLHRLAFDCENPDIMYASATRCGIWRSKDGGRSWHPVGDSLPTMGFLGLAADPFEKGLVYAIGIEYGGHGGIFRSETYGEGWVVINTDFHGEASYTKLVPNKNERGVYYATNASGLWKSTDGCRTWTQLFRAKAGVTTGEPLDIVLAEKDYRGIFMVVAPDGTSQATIAKSLDGGQTWTYITNNLPNDGYSGRITLHQQDPRIMYAAFKQPSTTPYTVRVYKSTDRGETWQKISSFQPLPDWNPRENANVMRTDPDDPNTVFICGVNIYRSNDGGQSFQAVSQVHADQHFLVFHPTNHNIVFALNDGGIYRSSDRTKTWESWSHNLPNVEFWDIGVSTTNPSMVVGGTQDNGSISTFGSANWWNFQGGDGGTTLVNPKDDTEIYAMTQFANSWARYVVKRENPVRGGGRPQPPAVWEYHAANGGLENTGGITVPSADINPVNPQELAICADDLYVTKNKGVAWTKALEKERYGNIIRTCYDGSGKLYAVADSGEVLLSKKEARNDFAVISSSSVDSLASWPTDIHVDRDGNVLVAYDPMTYGGGGLTQGKVWMLSLKADGTYQSEDITANLLEEERATAVIAAPIGERVVYLGTYNGVKKGKRQSDGTWAWEDFNAGLPLAPVIELEINKDDAYLYVATTGRGAFRTRFFSRESPIERR